MAKYLKIVYKNTLENYDNYIYYKLNTLNLFDRLLSPCIFLIGAIYECINAYNYYLIDNTLYLNRSLKNILIFTIISILLLIYMKNLFKLLFKLDFKFGLKHTNWIFCEKSVELKEHYILYKRAKGKFNVIEYSKIKKVVENKDCLYLIRKTRKQNYLETPIIPIHSFNSDTEKRQFITLLKTKSNIN